METIKDMQSVTDCNQHETVDIESRCIYGEAKDAEPVGNAAFAAEDGKGETIGLTAEQCKNLEGWLETVR